MRYASVSQTKVRPFLRIEMRSFIGQDPLSSKNRKAKRLPMSRKVRTSTSGDRCRETAERGICERSTLRLFHRLTRRTSSGRVMLRRAVRAGGHGARRAHRVSGNAAFAANARAQSRGDSRALL